MSILQEVPGALERPSRSRIVVTRNEADGSAAILIPARGASPILWIACLFLMAQLLLTLYIGAMLFVGHQSVLMMREISPDALPLPLQKFQWWFVLGWIALEGLGCAALLAVVRPALTRETLLISRESVTFQRAALRPGPIIRIERANVQGFQLTRDPQGVVGSVLTLAARGQSLVVGEYAREDEREWLASVGTAFLRGQS